jgi:hypothetical protein
MENRGTLCFLVGLEWTLVWRQFLGAHLYQNPRFLDRSAHVCDSLSSTLRFFVVPYAHGLGPRGGLARDYATGNQ